MLLVGYSWSAGACPGSTSRYLPAVMSITPKQNGLPIPSSSGRVVGATGADVRRQHDVMPKMIEAVLFDLDETITDRSASLAKYAGLFHTAFAGCIGRIDVGEI